MPRRLFALSATAVLLLSAASPAQDAKPKRVVTESALPPHAPEPAAPGVSTIYVYKLAPAAAGPPERALRYLLLPPQIDRTPGNAAPLWLQAGLALREEERKLQADPGRWFQQPNPQQKEQRELLERFAGVLRLADLAARRAHCDWEHPPLTLQHFGENIPLAQMQLCRELSNALAFRCRFELRERRFDDAARTLQTGLTLARNVGQGGTLIEHLVGNALVGVFLGIVQEWMRTPGSPDLYWPLTALPSPFIDMRPLVAYETDTVYRSFPALRRLLDRRGGERLSEAEVERVARELCGDLAKFQSAYFPDSKVKITPAALVDWSGDEAKKYLLAHGWNEERVKAMSPLATALTYFCEQHDEACDEVLKWMNVPYWQGREGLEKAVKASSDSAGAASGNPVVRLLFPVNQKVFQAWVRTERMVAALRTAEALRLYAVEHGGNPPAKLHEITAVPLPVDPATGKGFDNVYTVRDGKAVLELTAPPMAWRFEMPAGKP